MSISIPYNKEWYEGVFHDLEQNLNGAKASPIHLFRKKSFEQFTRLGFPSTKNEDWKYTDLTPIARGEFHKNNAESFPAMDQVWNLIGHSLEGTTILISEGRVSENLDLSLPQGVTLQTFSNATHDNSVVNKFGSIAVADSNSIVALNSSFFEDGVALTFSKETAAKTAINIVIHSEAKDKTVNYPRILVSVESGADITINEIHISKSTATHLSVSVVEIDIEAGARCQHVKCGLASESAIHLGHTAVNIARDGYYKSQCITFGGSLVRNEFFPKINGKNIECILNGLTVISNSQHVDNHTVLDHIKPNSHSSELYKGIYRDQSSGVFSGTIIVRQEAQKTDAFQSNQSLLLSPQAKIETRPQLKIWADDVKCTHGATVGQLDEEALFYLRSRGIGANEARAILVKAFAFEVVEQIHNPVLTELITSKLLSTID